MITRLPRRLEALADPSGRRGRRHPLVGVLLVACSVVVAGARSLAAIGQRARSAPQDTLARLEITCFAAQLAPYDRGRQAGALRLH
ncbi:MULTISPECIES: transposase family protein [unclassified Kitasatospora]|uniref:transposase family protein n=1 Tax=unclassified Kitasatospora TaxID=2633591 RepID=UPI0032AF7055